MKLPDLDELASLEAIAGYAWSQVNDPTAAGESVNPVTNREQAYIRAVRSDQAIAQWYITHSEAIKSLIWAAYHRLLHDVLSHEPHQ
jgi:hypothetical protein